MGLRKDAIYNLKKDLSFKVPSHDIILMQAKMQIKKGKSTGSTKLDIEAIRSLEDDELSR